ncbi:MAG: hypothetical protein JW818_17065 [Pirellulales bacterium]|nr:hypothetical protein [Pirellulales bacterium]
MPVPSLSELRRNSGQAAFESSIIDTINRMVRNGELPWGNECAICRLPTDDTFCLYAQCERKWTIRSGRTMKSGCDEYAFWILGFFLIPFSFFSLFDDDADEGPREMGHDRGVELPLRVRKEHHPKLRRVRSQRKLRRLLRDVPIYAKLLKEYPRARIMI